MVEEDVQLAWKLSIAGAEEVKQRLAEVHDQFNKGEITVQQYGKELKSNDSTLRALTSNTQLQTRAWLAQHPTINTLSRSMSGLNRVLSATTAAMTAINTASLLMRSDTGQTIDLQNQLAEAERNYNAALDPAKKEEYAKQIAAIHDQMDAVKKTADEDFVNRLFAVGTGIASVATSIIISLPKLVEFRFALAGLGDSIGGALATIGTFFAGIGPVLATGAALFGTIAGAITAIGLAIYFALTPGDTLAEWLKSIFPSAAEGIDAASEMIDKFFREVLIGGGITALTWLATVFVGGVGQTWDLVKTLFAQAQDSISSAFVAFWSGLDQVAKSVSTSVINTVSSMVDRIISAVRRALDYLAKLPGNIAGSISDYFSGGSKTTTTGTSVPKYAAGGSFTTDGPQMFIAGEGGVREEVSVKSIGRAGSTSSEGGNVYVTINNAGSVVAERDLERLIDKYGIREARRRGWKAR